MGRQREPIERDESGRSTDPVRELVDALTAWRLRRHEPEHDDLVVWHRAKRRERSGAIVVVLEQQPLRPDSGEDPLGQPVVPALDEPSAGLVPPAQMKAERDARVIADDVVVELEAELERALDRPAPALVEVSVARVGEERVVRRVELDVGRAEPHELGDLLA